MHMADALLSPVVGATFWTISGGLTVYAAKKIRDEHDPVKTPLMGVLGAFIFAAQMINFTIPGTGSSGHLGGGLLLAILLGPHRAFLTLASVLLMQSLFFADGGILALGCNMFNMAFLPAFIAYPLLYRPIAGDSLSPRKMAVGSVVAATAALLLGSCSVVVQTMLSGITELPFNLFVLFMLPIHFAIGIVEGLITWFVLSFVLKTEPRLLTAQPAAAQPRFMITALMIAALLIGGVGSWFASSHPDGLEWSVAKVTGSKEFSREHEPVHEMVAALQQHIAFLPDYGFKNGNDAARASSSNALINTGSSVSGIVGALFVLVVAGTAGRLLGRKQSHPTSSE